MSDAAADTATPQEGDEQQPVVLPAPPVRRPVYDDREQRNAQARMWLTSFTDLFSLLLCFFVLLFSAKDIDLEKMKIAKGKMGKIQPGYDSSGFTGGEGDATNIARVEYGQALDLDYLIGVLKKNMDQIGLSGDVAIKTKPDHLELEIDTDKVFAGGKVLSTDGVRIIKGLGEGLVRLSNRISVVVPVEDWDIGMGQASALGQTMREGGYRKPFVVLADGAADDDAVIVRIEADDGRIR